MDRSQHWKEVRRCGGTGNTKHTFCVCWNKRINPLTKEEEICRYEYRKDKTNKKAHTCFDWNKTRPIKPQKQTEISDYADRVEPKYLKSTYEKCISKFIEFIGTNDISMRASCSGIADELCLLLIILGQENPTIEARRLWPKLHRDFLTAEFIKSSEEVECETYKAFINAKYNSLACDAWSFNYNHHFEIMLVNSLLKIKPLLIKSYDHFPDTTTAYRNALREAIKFLDSKNIRIGSLVTDNLARQVSAVSPDSENSFQQDPILNLKVPWAKSVMHVRCACHTLQLVLLDASNKVVELDEAISAVTKIVSLFRNTKISLALGTTCPSYTLNRWNSVFLVVKWFANNLELIINLLIGKMEADMEIRLIFDDNYELVLSFIFNHLIVLYAAFLPYFRATEILESDFVSIGHVYPYLIASNQKSHELAENLGLEILEQIANEMEASMATRFFETKEGQLLLLAFTLTPYGRNVIRSHLDHSMIQGEQMFCADKVTTPKFEITKQYSILLQVIIKTMSKQDTIIPQINKYIKDKPWEYLLDIAKDNDSFCDDSEPYTVEEEEEDYYEEEENLEDSSDEENKVSVEDYLEILEKKYDQITITALKDLSDTDINMTDADQLRKNNGALSNGASLLGEIGVLMGLDGQRIQDLYTEYIICDTANSPYQILYSNDQIWKFWSHIESVPDLHDFAAVAKGLLSCPAAEACVERRIKTQKQIEHDSRRNRSGKALRKARGVYLSTKRAEK